VDIVLLGMEASVEVGLRIAVVLGAEFSNSSWIASQSEDVVDGLRAEE